MVLIQQSLNFSQQAFDIYGLGIIIIATGSDGLIPVGGHGVGGKAQNRNGLSFRIFFQLTDGFPSITGRLMSRSRLGDSERAIFTPSWPSTAMRTSKPFRSKRRNEKDFGHLNTLISCLLN